MSHNSNEEKTENPTAYRLKQAKKKGKNQYSRELYSFLILLISLVNFFWNGKLIIFYLKNLISIGLIFDNSVMECDFLLQHNYFFSLIKDIFYLLEIIFLPILVLSTILIVLGSSMRFNIKLLTFDIDKINFVIGLKKLFSLQNSINLLKAIVKIILMSIVLFYLISKHFLDIFHLINSNIEHAIFSSIYVILEFLLIVLISLFPVVVFDVFFEYYNFYRKLRMTRKEIKDELKHMEGNPHIKNRIRQIMRTNTRRNMLINVSKSDVVIVNPINYAIALQYDENRMHAPKVLAKGKGLLALKIKKIGINYSVPIFPSSNLAKILYNHANVGQYIPCDLYSVIAEVLAWVWKIKQWKKVGGDFPQYPNDYVISLQLNNYRNGKDKQ